MCAVTASDPAVVERNRQAIEELIANPGRQTYRFEPIIDLSTEHVVGYRSRTAGQVGTGLHTTPQLIEAAVATGLLDRLDWAVRTFLMNHALERGLKAQLHFTPEPPTYGRPCPPDLSLPFVRARQELRMAAEIPVAAFDEEWLLRSGVGQFRSYGWLVVIDDVADHPNGLELAEQIEPQWVRLDLDLPGRLPPVSDNVAQMLDWAKRSGVSVLAHGVSSPTRRQAAVDLGAAFARGSLVGLAGELP
jgi:EAL domain-containing protein (putative c-di-GMP-specific phosphodiesterase class I)